MYVRPPRAALGKQITDSIKDLVVEEATSAHIHLVAGPHEDEAIDRIAAGIRNSLARTRYGEVLASIFRPR